MIEQRRRAWLAHDDGDEAMIEKQIQERAIAQVAMQEQHKHLEFLVAQALASVQRGQIPSAVWQARAEMMLRLLNQDRKERESSHDLGD